MNFTDIENLFARLRGMSGEQKKQTALLEKQVELLEQIQNNTYELSTLVRVDGGLSYIIAEKKVY